MDPIQKEEFTELINHHGNNCISIYIPTHRAGVEVNEKQDAIVFKNTLQAINIRLQNQGLNAQQIEKLLKPGFELYNNEIFWNSQYDGLAVFLADGFVKTIQLPYSVKEEIYVNNSFFISPLLPAISNNEEFYLLLLSKQDARFYQGNAFGLQRIMVEGLPNGMDDVVHFEEKEGQQLLRQGGRGGTGGASFHGHGNGQLDDKENISIYFQEVDRTLFAEILHDKNLPLLLCGVEYLIPIYKSLSKYNFISEQFVGGNQENESLNGLFEKARTALTPYFKERTRKALERYYNSIATALTSSMPEKIVPASYYAQIATLFICKDAHVWGKFNEADNQIEIHQDRQEGDECLLNQAAAKTYINGGEVFLLEKEQMPKESIIAALLRF